MRTKGTKQSAQSSSPKPRSAYSLFLLTSDCGELCAELGAESPFRGAAFPGGDSSSESEKFTTGEGAGSAGAAGFGAPVPGDRYESPSPKPLGIDRRTGLGVGSGGGDWRSSGVVAAPGERSEGWKKESLFLCLV